MKKVYSTSDSIEANMITDFLNHEGIGARIQKEYFLNEIGHPYEVWIDNPADQQKADEIISDITEKQVVKAEGKNGSGRRGFIWGMISGIVLMAIIVWLVLYVSPNHDYYPDSWDSNGDEASDIWYVYSGDKVTQEIRDSDFDGKADTWYYYSDSEMIDRAEYDNNFDGIVDAWNYYSSNAMLDRVEYDNNHDGSPDYWEYYENNQRSKYEADNDWNGKHEEWGAFQNGIVHESMWSFRDDGIVDKKVLYSHGIKFKVLLDLDRDGRFDEQIFYDKLERVIKKEKLR